jgi:hypothetical protein
LEVVRVEIRVRLKGGKIAVYVRSEFMRGRGEVLKAEKDIDSLGIDLKSLAGRFREGYDYSVRWFVREVARLVESKLWKTIGTMYVEAITNPDLNPAVYPVYICYAWLLEEVADEKIHVGYTTSVLRFGKCFAIKDYNDAYILPYDVSKINLEKTDEKSIRIYENVYRLIKNIRTKYDVPDDIGGVMDYYMFLYESLGVR